MESLPIINKSYEVYKSIISLNSSLGKRHQFSLGISIEQSVIKLIEQLIMAKHAPKPLKASYLLNASAQLDITRLKLRLFLELKLVNETRLFQTQNTLSEIGRMLGGWLKALQTT